VQTQPVTVIIRSKNEEKWIGSCLFAVQNQDYPGFDVVLVDNESKDETVAIANRFGAQVLTIPEKEFNFSRALNLGISAAKGVLIAILSAHCIPTDDQWLARLVMNFNEPQVMAVYGRQKPLPDSSPYDKRDLWITFGMDRKQQRRDYFFHNANSMIRRDLWEQMPFNENIHGVEDQDWAKRVLQAGGQIIYEPSAAVFHHHGIHHAQNEERVDRVVRVIELIQKDMT
jgi:glycosyltransferase involved in cell wall biosynthesis